MRKTLLAEFTVLPGNEERVAELVEDYAVRVREEPGNLAFEVYTKEAAPRSYWIFEVYTDEAAFRTHLAAPYGPPFNAALQPLIEERESALTFLSPLAR
ncbi:antibiotic biosynthesis monooxygenase family protein [Streptomyces sp. NPDC006197]|uniref:putative quinol monooxygenase n=1 Tax=Streptomyces sp. NPDC006197 TaxID=3156685 RepID=UPI0033B3DA92